MAAKRIPFSQEAREAIRRGVNTLAKAGKVTNVPEANKYLTKEYRNDWPIEG